ncbi:aldehyde dehydrogenase (NAD+) [Microbacterium terrae]|uniref:Aldehyde dehydrogenase n=1 Tax=Microbacterium terrae TaxID=69369 RepID=A0A0M2H816_9MICO|nr:aldehyde dehydrogenase family protein [Microbacterium terrae]KJL40126.1 putative succinate-semialdehyde dehydrogenase [NADP(+)] 2 [Microbacterium terrae]MBP1079270.1 aldehyde dehydrogenase (NAD+) [Microbacterium terrae]GLJ98669.1 aldehyde dehydrogenase [Microbacterium terrae]
MTLLADSGTPGTYTTVDPRDGSAIESYPVDDAAAVRAAVGRAREAAAWWAAQDHAGRKRVLLRWKSAIARDAASLAQTISRETGKPESDALLEVMLTLTHLDWAAKNAEGVLKRRKVHAGLMNYNQKASVGYEPYGVVGVIGPWNYPFYTPMGSISYALAAGNAVVFKPSELTPGTAVWIARKWAEVCDEPVLQAVTGDGATGAALVSSGVDKVAFTGSTRTAKKVMALCALSLTPLVAECGGKDALIVAADADLDAAASFIAFGAFGNAGQTCVGVERVYVDKTVADALIAKVVERGERVRVGGETATYGPMTLPSQTAVIAAHIGDALERGGTAALGGRESVGERFVEPVVLVDVPEDSDAVRHETFGPTVVINTVSSVDEAVQRANATDYGLGAAVFTRSAATGRRAAKQLRAGVVTINSVLGFAGIPALPFGGVKGSGFGRIHGADGLREFSTPKSVAHQTSKAALNLLTLERSHKDDHMVARMLPMLHGRAK